MKPVHQTPGDNQCLRHCIATIFELPVEDVPFFGGDLAFHNEARENGHYGVLQSQELRAWLRTRGLDYLDIYTDDEGRPKPMLPWGLCIASGPTARDTQHAVVWDARFWDEPGNRVEGEEYGRMVHDPHPSGIGLLKVESWTCFVVIDPINPRPHPRLNPEAIKEKYRHAAP